MSLSAYNNLNSLLFITLRKERLAMIMIDICRISATLDSNGFRALALKKKQINKKWGES